MIDFILTIYLNNVILNKVKKSYKDPEIYSPRQISVIQTFKDPG